MGYVKKKTFVKEKHLIHSILQFNLKLAKKTQKLKDNKNCPRHKWLQATQWSLPLLHFHFLTFLKYLSGVKR